MDLSKPVAICCIGYNRPDSMRRLLKNIGNGIYTRHDIPLIISIDQCDVSDEVQAVAEEFNWSHGEKEILRYPERMGLRCHIMKCGDLTFKYGAVIILEDDVIVAPDYYQFTEKSLQRYSEDEKVFGIGLYSQKWNFQASLPHHVADSPYDVFWANYDISSGQCWVDYQWRKFREWFAEWENHLPKANYKLPQNVLGWPESTSWCKYMCFYLAEKGLYNIVPYGSLSTNMGAIGSHTSIENVKCQVPLREGHIEEYRFCNYEEAIKIDLFFERTDFPCDEIAGISVEDICVNLKGLKYDLGGKKYMLSCEKLKYEIIASWDTTLEPLEENIILNNLGEGIYLYYIPESGVYRKGKKSKSVLVHYAGKYAIKQLIYAAFLKAVNGIGNIIHKCKFHRKW